MYVIIYIYTHTILLQSIHKKPAYILLYLLNYECIICEYVEVKYSTCLTVTLML